LKNNQNEIFVRVATQEDAAALVDIYAPYVLHTGITFEYDVPDVEEFRSRICKVLLRYPYLVAQRGDELLGYSYANPLGERAAFSRAAETVLYVRRDARGLGIGSLLYARLEEILKQQHVTNLNACIAWRDEEDETLTHASPSFHAACGYRKIAHFKSCGYKHGRWYDLIWMEKFIADHGDAPPPFIPFPELKEF
jgi:phosphinothricin acetyltransferase